MEQVILVDEADKEIGTMEKMKAHRLARLHRAFSVFIFNDRGELLLQQRASGKYHSPGLWSNTCCGHPRPGETIVSAAQRRLKEEMGFSCPLKEVFRLVYRSEFENGLVEHEVDHVLQGNYSKDPQPEPGEASDFRWISISALRTEIMNTPERFTTWLKLITEKHDFRV